jgi:phosphate-selective porin OprO/OprP
MIIRQRSSTRSIRENNLFTRASYVRHSLATIFLSSIAIAAHADDISTHGGLTVRSSDGKFAMNLGGRIHFDGYLNSTDDNAARIGSGNGGDTGSNFQFRRVFLSLKGELYNFQYDIDYDLSKSSFQDLWVSHALLPGGTLYVGQLKPWRSLDELASNNVTVFLERNINSATGVYGGVDYTNGLYYAWRQHALSAKDSLWAGVSGYSLHKQANGQNNTQGVGYNARLAYAPWIDASGWTHVGVSYSSDHADTASGTSDSYTSLGTSYAYGGRTGAKVTLASYGFDGDPHADSAAAELAGAFGPAYVQAEYTDVSYHQQGVADNTVSAYSVTAAYALTGETRSYSGIKPKHSYGAFEVGVRYDHGRNDEHGGSFVGLKEAGVTKGASVAGDVTQADVSLISVGLNYYVNPAVRFMLDYGHGHVDLGQGGKDNPDTVGVRGQIAF